MSKIVILTGAGISAESGLLTFRDADGLWEGHRVEDVATPEAFSRQPDVVQNFYNLRRAQLQSVEPHAAHHALAKLQAEWPHEVMLITQNVDDLHERAGSQSVLHMHGELLSARHTKSGEIKRLSQSDELLDLEWRPDIVWFGEMPYFLDEIESALQSATLFVAIGTSGAVYPAAGFVQQAKLYGAKTVLLNKDAPDNNEWFDDVRVGSASNSVPEWVDELLQVKKSL